MNKIAVVAISGSTKEFDKKYHYSIPDSLSGKVILRVRVLNNAGTKGWTAFAYKE